MIFVNFYEFVNFREIMVVFYLMIDTVIVSSLVETISSKPDDIR